MRKYIVFLFVSISGYLPAQNALTASGGESEGVLWNIGQIVTETIIDENVSVFQGFVSPDKQVLVSIGSSIRDVVSIEVYPNPVKDKFFIEFPDSNGFTWKLVDMLGLNIKSGMVSSNKEEINISECSAGQYILIIKSDKNIQSVIILKK